MTATPVDTYNKDKCCGAIHVIRAFSAASQVVLGQVEPVDERNQLQSWAQKKAEKSKRSNSYLSQILPGQGAL
ncbi:hypothetical protein VCRA2122O12_360029 [Vibrio crassostreae]|nr:hypothetical protein [Vibrio crassostreae]TCN93856.1 hypothetical protein EDB51_1219 [Vibrio crassostreae]CAK2011587.1 hypothetical protein VCRA2114E5_330010 [Vibrio crassostreae]CAK2015379.1 hypothetical protein VCRA2110O4_350030 [Vibrio crassostreae]CAK2020018.1 hypothetical protein VCRA2110O1_360010 [Vibrio crassostreae]CAK2802873.1 hypothetical protein VCRA2110O3_340011 [Vibrio crassostreae]